jgi:hypothetical protein
MALEPLNPAMSGEGAELRDMTRRFWVGVALSAPLLAMAMAEHFAKDALDAVGDVESRAGAWPPPLGRPPTGQLAGASARDTRRSLGRLALL